MTEQRTTQRASERRALRIVPPRHVPNDATGIPLETRIAFLTGRPATPPTSVRRIRAALSLSSLSATALPVLAGAAIIGASAHPLSLVLVGACFVAVAALRLAIQFRLDADVHEDLCTPGHAHRTAARASVRALAIAAIAFIPIVAVTGWGGMIVATATVGAAYAYLGGLVTPGARGALDPIGAVAATVACVVTVVTALGGHADASAIIVGVQLGLLGALPQLVQALRDEPIDQIVGHATWATLFGADRTLQNAVLALVLAFAGAAWWSAQAHWAAAALPLLAIPAAVRLAQSLRHHPTGPILNVLSQPMARLHLGFGVLLVIGIAAG